MHTTQLDTVRQQLLRLLDNGDAHLGFEEAIRDFPIDAINQYPPNTRYTPWHILEHMRFAQREILDLIESDNFVQPKWPDDYWPAPDATADEATWHATIQSFRDDLDAFRAIATDESRDLFAIVRNSEKRTLLDTICNVAAHNHFHIGEFAILRQVMSTWPAGDTSQR